ncbi:PREDICTED: F-box protein VBF-like [Ipomoea nil]|uniref:F-box protein VBF-like n=1 Tax=Ipomoea nil TaxID=35883 RepID=UPI000901D0E6|nr:PREDICTED: F-box protein VBF-like [Ipomoea nil]
MPIMEMLPEDCLSTILSLTSPLDAFRLSSVSSTLRSAADSDSVWGGFLPPDYKEIVAKSVTATTFSSNKDLFVRLCNSILIDDGKKSFALEKSSGLKSYMLSAKELSILYSDEPEHWTWKSIPESRFSEAAELKMICRLEIEGKVKRGILSPNTNYGVYLVMNISDGAFGLDSRPCEMSVKVGDRGAAAAGIAYLQAAGGAEERRPYRNRVGVEMAKPQGIEGGERRDSRRRSDGWMEVELGEFFNGGEDGGDEEITMSLSEVKGCHVKGGLIVQGIEIRPKFRS